MATVPTRNYATCRRVCTTSGVLPLAGGDRTGRKDLTRKTQTGNGRSDPAIRSKTSHAAKSGVGEHTARESESAQRVRRERVRGEHPPPNLAPEPQGSGALFFLRPAPPPQPQARFLLPRQRSKRTALSPRKLAAADW